MVDTVKNSRTLYYINNATQRTNDMQRRIFNTRSARQARRAMFDVIGAVLLIGASVVMLLAYFDVLTKG